MQSMDSNAVYLKFENISIGSFPERSPSMRRVDPLDIFVSEIYLSSEEAINIVFELLNATPVMAFACCLAPVITLLLKSIFCAI